MSSGANYGVQAVGHGSTVLLAPHVAAVRHGTPLRSGPLGWEPTLEPPDAYAGNTAGGGERLAVYRSLTLARGTFTAGARYVLADIQQGGALVFTERADGPYVAWSPTEIVLDAAAAALSAAAAASEREAARAAGETHGESASGVSSGASPDGEEAGREPQGRGRRTRQRDAERESGGEEGEPRAQES